jgi:hypothetical protein
MAGGVQEAARRNESEDERSPVWCWPASQHGTLNCSAHRPDAESSRSSKGVAHVSPASDCGMLVAIHFLAFDIRLEKGIYPSTQGDSGGLTSESPTIKDRMRSSQGERIRFPAANYLREGRDELSDPAPNPPR